MRVSDAQVRYAGAMVAAALLENASLPGHEDALRKAVRLWFPDSDKVDGQELRRVTALVRQELLYTRAAIMNRNDKRVNDGTAAAV